LQQEIFLKKENPSTSAVISWEICWNAIKYLHYFYFINKTFKHIWLLL